MEEQNKRVRQARGRRDRPTAGPSGKAASRPEAGFRGNSGVSRQEEGEPLGKKEWQVGPRARRWATQWGICQPHARFLAGRRARAGDTSWALMSSLATLGAQPQLEMRGHRHEQQPSHTHTFRDRWSHYSFLFLLSLFS